MVDNTLIFFALYVSDREEMLRRGLSAQKDAVAGSLLRSMAANVLEETGSAASGGAADDKLTIGDKAQGR